MAEIREAGRYADGRYDLLVAGTGRFVLDSVDATREPYLVGEVTPLEDEVGVQAAAERLAATAIRRFVRYLSLVRARDGETEQILDVRVEIDAPEAPTAADRTEEVDVVVGDVTDPVPAESPAASSLRIPDDPTTLSYLLAGIVAIEDPRRQTLLEAGTTVERLTALVELLDREVVLLGYRLRLFTADPAVAAVRRA
jgi:Lon protease-like protein